MRLCGSLAPQQFPWVPIPANYNKDDQIIIEVVVVVVMLVRWMMVDVGVDKEADDVAKQGLCGNEAA